MPKKSPKKQHEPLKKIEEIPLTPFNKEWDFPTEGRHIWSTNKDLDFIMTGYEFQDATSSQFYEGKKGEKHKKDVTRYLDKLKSLRTGKWQEHFPDTDVPLYDEGKDDIEGPVHTNMKVKDVFPEIWEHDYQIAYPNDAEYFEKFKKSDWFDGNSKTRFYDDPKFKYPSKPKKKFKEGHDDILKEIRTDIVNPFKKIVNENNSPEESFIDEYDVINNQIEEVPVEDPIYDKIMDRQEEEIYNNQYKNLNYNLTNQELAEGLDIIPQEAARRQSNVIYPNVINTALQRGVDLNNTSEMNKIIEEESDNFNRNQFVYQDDIGAWRDRWESLKGIGQFLMDTVNKYKRQGLYGLGGLASMYALYKLIQYLNNRPKPAAAVPVPDNKPVNKELPRILRRAHRRKRNAKI